MNNASIAIRRFPPAATLSIAVGLLVLVVATAFAAPISHKPLPAGKRILAVDVSPAENGDYAQAFTTARLAGMQCITLSLFWSELEPTPGHYNDSLLDIANAFYPPRNTSVILGVRPINTDRLELPADLRGYYLDSPVVIGRFERLLDHVFAHLPKVNVAALAIGDEVDAYLGADDRRWRQYDAFYATTRAYAKHIRPGLKVGVPTTFNGLSSRCRANVAALNSSSDVIMATYYPVDADFIAEPPSVVGRDFDRLAALYPHRPIMLTEAGYPCGAACKSSPALQAQFIDRVFAAWDAHASRFQCIAFTRMTDMSPADGQGDARYYGENSSAFLGFLTTLGLRTYPGAGADRPAWLALVRDARARGW